ncbi:MAG: hypothetical protein L0323_00855, partial [Planctomycetes bacterium]|nr:hypothetical protein [Planctomycetota bacterium]
LSRKTLALLDETVGERGRSLLIGRALRHYLDFSCRAAIEERMAEGAKRRAARDLRMAQEWFPLEEEAWETWEEWEKRGRPPTPDGGRSTSSTSTLRSARRSGRSGRR